MSIETKPDVPCAICGKVLPDTELIVMMRVCMEGQHPPALHHAECVECHYKERHHPDTLPDLCLTLRDYRDGLIGLWWRRAAPYWEMAEIEVEDGDLWLRRRWDRA